MEEFSESNNRIHIIKVRFTSQQIYWINRIFIKSGFDEISTFLKHITLEYCNLISNSMNYNKKFADPVISQLTKIIELEKEALSQLEFLSIHVIKEEKVKEK